MKINIKLPLVLVSFLLLSKKSFLQISPYDFVVTKSALSVPLTYSGSIHINYIRTWDARQAVGDTTGLVNDLEYFKQTTQYFDGLGRPIQTVVKAANYDGSKDIVSMNLYDSFGRETFSYLPFPKDTATGKFKLDPFTYQKTFYNSELNDQRPFQKTGFEPSPLNRVIKEFASGNSWIGSDRFAEHRYLLNTASDSVRIATINSKDDWPSFTGTYSAGTLSKNVSVDEDSNQVIEYKDRFDHTILKKVQDWDSHSTGCSGWLCTYYVYDDLGRLSYVLQPKASAQMSTSSWTPDESLMNELGFIYRYDKRGRMIMKKVPGAGIVNMAYDKRDRLVYTQDANMRTSNPDKWLCTFYDAMNRDTSTALYATNDTLLQLQTALNGLTSANPVPSLSENDLTRLSYKFYDYYPINAEPFSSYVMDMAFGDITGGDEVVDDTPYARCTRGKMTWSSSRVLDSSLFLKTTTYYDYKSRPILTFTGNHRGGGTSIIQTYSFTGKPLTEVVGTNNPYGFPTAGEFITTRKVYQNNFLVSTDSKIDSGPWQPLSRLEYNDLGKPNRKELGHIASNFFTNYTYNIRGWLTGLNSAEQTYILNEPYETFYTPIFSESLHYDMGFNSSKYNGNIVGVKWTQTGDNQVRAFGFTYDHSNRFKIADYTQYEGSGWGTSAGIDFSVRNMKYDANGNILNMSQMGYKISSSEVIDSLNYTYLSNSNKLAKVTDVRSDAGTRLGDFKDGTNTGMDDYNYDANGNLVADSNKHISSIVYNYLNLPKTITVSGKGTIEYKYDANGNKLQKKTTEGTKITRTDYVGGYNYINDTLQFISHEEGRLRYSKKYFLNGDSAYQWQWDFFYKDHLGNIRTVVTEQKDTSKYMATLETGPRTQEVALFTNITETAFDKSGIGGYPTDNTTSPNYYVSRLDGFARKLGMSITLKVMAGDTIDLATKAIVASGTESEQDVTPENLVASMLSTLSLKTAALSSGKAAADQLAEIGGPLYPGLADFLYDESHDRDTHAPAAYLNWVLFDEQFKYVPGCSNFIQVSDDRNTLQTLANSDIVIPKSGYFFVYLSNGSGINVDFDNFVVQHRVGPLVEEESYYPFGLVMAGISSKAFGGVENKLKFNKGSELQNKEFADGSGLEMYDTHFRNLDPQLGRWNQIDPKIDSMHQWSPYNSMFDNPIRFNDPLGDSSKPQQAYTPPPKGGLPGFPDAGKGSHNPKSDRWRWKLPGGDILEWDKQHGEVERYDRTGNNHKGAYDPKTGDQIKDPVPGRTTPKFTAPNPVGNPYEQVWNKIGQDVGQGAGGPINIPNTATRVVGAAAATYIVIKAVEAAAAILSGGALSWTLIF